MPNIQETFPHRKNIRLSGYDYSSEGTYFITTVTKDRVQLFGDVIDGEMRLNEYGRIVEEEWIRSASIRKEIELDEYMVMPNHFHAIVHFIQTNQHSRRGDRPVAPTCGPRPHSLGALMAGFKSSVTIRINSLRATPGIPVWQRNYYEHIISTDREYEEIAKYISDNPLNWSTDAERF